MWGAPLHLAWRRRIAEGRMIGPTIYTAGPILYGENPAHDGSFVVRTPDEAARAVALHREAGYDFVKVYSGLTPAAYAGVMVTAKAGGLRVAGHVPRAVGVDGVLEAGQTSIEHLNALFGAIQADGSPVAGKTDRPSGERWIDHVDEAKIPDLARRISHAHAWVCPTRVVMNQLGTAAERTARMQRPEMRYVPVFEKAIWDTGEDPFPGRRDRDRHALAVGDALLRGLHAGGARLVAGTDVGNPFVVAGFSLHEELERFVAAGFTPYEALRAATVDAADLLHAADDFGTVTVGKRADLLLLDGDPLADVAQAERIAGVMARGRWLGAGDLVGLLAKVEEAASAHDDPFANRRLVVPAEYHPTLISFQVTWKDVPFGMERGGSGLDDALVRRFAVGESYDPHTGQWLTMSLWAGRSGLGERLVLEGDGAAGQGRVEVIRDGTQAHLRGTLLSGAEASLDVQLPAGAVLGAAEMLSERFLPFRTVGQLPPGASVEVPVCEVSFGSAAEMPVKTWKITRLVESTSGKLLDGWTSFAIDAGEGPPQTLVLNARGWPEQLDLRVHGGALRFRHVER
jgi:Amidohydrolase family